MRAAVVCSLVLLALSNPTATDARPQTQTVRQQFDPIIYLEAEMARLAAQVPGRVGAVAVHVETGRIARLNADEGYPMASVVKFPIALLLMTQVDRGQIRLDEEIVVTRADIQPGSGLLGNTLPHPGIRLSVANLLEIMMTESDNSATDRLLALVGGPAAVSAHLRALGVTQTRVDRSIRDLLADAAGIAAPAVGEAFTRRVYNERVAALPTGARELARQRFELDLRDTADPDEMSLLLARLMRGELMSPASTAFLMAVMDRTTTGRNRLRGMLPEGTPVAHKTGTLSGTTNDIGIITLPNGAGHVAVSVFVKQSPATSREREPAIAQIARAAHDFFLFNRAPETMRTAGNRPVMLPPAPVYYSGGLSGVELQMPGQ